MLIKKIACIIILVILATGCKKSIEEVDVPFQDISNSENGEVAKSLVFVTVISEEAVKTQWLIKVYKEAFKRLGIEFKLIDVPAARAGILSDLGEVDGELTRVYDYSFDHPNLIRIEEFHYSTTLSAFVRNDSELVFESWGDLNGQNLNVNYRRGIELIEKKLANPVDADLIKAVDNIDQGISKLLKGRTDVYVEVLSFMEEYLSSAEYKLKYGDDIIRNAGNIETVTAHLYVHKKHRDLVEKLMVVLKEMKNEGLYENYAEELGLDYSEFE